MASLQQLASEKERELQSLRQQHTNMLEQAIQASKHDLLQERKRQQQLQSDFEYNLSLLEQRDAELSQYDTAFLEVRGTVSGLVAENSELKVQLDTLRGELGKERLAQHRLRAHYTTRVEQMQTQMEAHRQAQQQRLEKEVCRVEDVREELGRRLLEVEGELAVQRQQMAAELEETLGRRDRESQARVQELNTALLARESQAKQLSHELEESKEEVGEGEGLAASLQQQVRVLQGEASEREARLAELEAGLGHTHSRMKAQQEEAERRHVEQDRLVRQKEVGLRAAKEAHQQREVALEGRVLELLGQLEQKGVELRQLEWSHADALQEKSLESEKLQQQLAECRSECVSRVSEVSRTIVERDLQLQGLEETCQRLRQELATREEDRQCYERELSLAVERERLLEQAKAQAELDWQRRLEEAERQQAARHQALLQQLTSARDQALAQCQELEEVSEQQETVVKAAQRERDIAMATLGRHGLAEEFQAMCREAGAGDHVTNPKDHMIQQLQQQNEELHRVIAEMREAMEQVTNRTEETEKPTNQIGAQSVLTVGYVKYLESEVVQLKAEKRQLGERIQELLARKKPPTPPPSHNRGNITPPPLGDKHAARHRSHLVALSDTIATLQHEKVTLEGQVLRLQSEGQRWRETAQQYQQQAYLLRACQVPHSKLHQKLLQATQVIISLVKEREGLVGELQQWRKGSKGRRKSEHNEQYPPDCLRQPPPEKCQERQWVSVGGPPQLVMGQGASQQEKAGAHHSHDRARDSEVQEEVSDPSGALEQHSLHSETGGAPKLYSEPGAQQLELSLQSLQFSDTSELESVQRVLQLVDSSGLASTLEPLPHASTLKPLPRASTPQLKETENFKAPEPDHPQTSRGDHLKTQTAVQPLFLQGKRMSSRPRPLHSLPVDSRRARAPRKAQVRNYNIKDS